MTPSSFPRSGASNHPRATHDRRRFVPEFRRMVGAAPKQYERICRFNSAVAAIRLPNARPLASVAVDHGFADQAHLSREIGHFAQISPSRLHRDGATMANHLEYDKIFKT
ncbi:MAG: helix-turn-helix domain-containing protein [Ilumatobacter sp.]|uniref:helix-turn-helix domain-containing protein n=1 Tax=Ilumatobacter sp. TaxID=1967498 RepID=UPI003297190A